MPGFGAVYGDDCSLGNRVQRHVDMVVEGLRVRKLVGFKITCERFTGKSSLPSSTADRHELDEH